MLVLVNTVKEYRIMVKSIVLGLGLIFSSQGFASEELPVKCEVLASKFEAESLVPKKFKLVATPKLKIPGAGFVFQSPLKDFMYFVMFTPQNLPEEKANLYGKCRADQDDMYMYVIKVPAKVTPTSGSKSND